MNLKPSTLNSRIDIANVAMMLLSFIVAYILPFKLFLFSYAVLGPLHYLTEIGWLKQRDFFFQSAKNYLFLVFLTVLLILGYFCSIVYNQATCPTALLFLREPPWIGPITFWAGQSPRMMFLAFVLALLLLLPLKNNYKIIGFVFALIASFWINQLTSFQLFFGALLPTVIHVCIFTGLFILAGALRNNSTAGFISLGVFVVCSSMFLWLPENPIQHQVSDEIKQIFVQNNFLGVNSIIFQISRGGEQLITDAGIGLNIQRFIAFAYTYHYLNWFSKVEVIKWHKVSKKWLGFSALFWISSVTLYWYDFKTGFLVLLFLSTLHVTLEFPLNYKSIIEIFTLIRSRLKT